MARRGQDVTLLYTGNGPHSICGDPKPALEWLRPKVAVILVTLSTAVTYIYLSGNKYLTRKAYMFHSKVTLTKRWQIRAEQKINKSSRLASLVYTDIGMKWSDCMSNVIDRW